MANKYAYFKSCTLEKSAREFDMSAKLVCQKLGIELQEIEDWNCCGATPLHSVNHLLALALPARNLAAVERMGLPMAIPCASCFSRHKIAAHELAEDEKLKEKVNSLLEESYRKEVEVKSLLQVIYEEAGPEKIKEMVTNQLEGIKVAPYYGCLLVRPPKIVQFDEAENPISMDLLLEATGAEVIDFPFKTACCSASLAITNKDIVAKLAGDILGMAYDLGANVISVACPLCHQNLDARQAQIKSRRNFSFSLPILYFTQIIGLSLGFSEKELGIDKHAVKFDLVSKGVKA